MMGDSEKKRTTIIVNLLVVFILALVFWGVWHKKIAQKQIVEEPLPTFTSESTQLPAPENINSYIVQKGDTLWDIAVKMYGAGFRWREIANANNIQDSASLKVGVRLKIPTVAGTTTELAESEPKFQQTLQGTNYYVSSNGEDGGSGISSDKPWRTIQKAVDIAEPGDVINLAEGEYFQDVLTRRSGTTSAPIVITGPQTAVLRGGGNARVIEVNHDYISFVGFTVDGLHGSSDSKSGYRDKLVYILGKGARSGVVGTKVFNLTLRNAGGECLRLRYFAQGNEIAYNTFFNCGRYDFAFKDGGKNGEGVYVGTAPEQVEDGKNPTTDPDQSNNNWIHHNQFDTQGNECVDIKETAEGNIVEYNSCTGQKDKNSGGMDSRGDGNIFRYNEIFGNRGAGVRLGGDKKSAGINNDVYGNTIRDNAAGGIKIQRYPQGKVCGNKMEGNVKGNSVGTYGSRFNPEGPC